jgi:histidine triad (HIT) family protein
MENCLFCQIVRGEKPCYKIYEDGQFLAFLDTYPHCYGHTLIIPKIHFRYVWDIPYANNLMFLAQKLVKHYQHKLKIDNCYATIFGEQIPHAHFQILPVLPQEHLTVTFSSKTQLAQVEAQEIIAKLHLS